MTSRRDSAPPGRPDEDARPDSTAAEFLGPALLSFIESARVTSRRVVASGQRRAVEAPEDDEAVHDFRVALRRLRTLLRPARRVYGKKRLRPVADGLRAFAQETGALRDEEVLRETLTALFLPREVRTAVDAWLARRGRRARAGRARVIARLRGDEGGSQRRKSAPPGPPPPRLEPCLAQLEKRVQRRKAKRLGADELARCAIDGALRDVRALSACDPADGPAMHALRIRFKRLRYSAETFAPLLGERADRIAKSASRMQRRLGQLHDVDEALASTGRARGLAATHRRAVNEALCAERARLVEKAREELARDLEALAGHWPGA